MQSQPPWHFSDTNPEDEMSKYWFVLSLCVGVACSGPSDEKGDTGAAESDTDTDADADTDTDADADADTGTVPASPSVTAAFTPSTIAPGETAQLDVWIEDYVVVDPTASPPPEPTAGEGHYHLYLGGEYFAAAWTPSVAIETTVDDLPGDYVFRVVLVDSGHTEIVPTVDTEVTLTIE